MFVKEPAVSNTQKLYIWTEIFLLYSFLKKKIEMHKCFATLKKKPGLGEIVNDLIDINNNLQCTFHYYCLWKIMIAFFRDICFFWEFVIDFPLLWQAFLQINREPYQTFVQILEYAFLILFYWKYTWIADMKAFCICCIFKMLII